MTSPWLVRLTAAAEEDFRGIVRWSSQRFGVAQSSIYAETVTQALIELSGGPAVIGVKARDEIGPGLFTLHVARHGRRGRHFILFRVGHTAEGPVIDVLRLLHDAMDLPRHRPE